MLNFIRANLSFYCRGYCKLRGSALFIRPQLLYSYMQYVVHPDDKLDKHIAIAKSSMLLDKVAPSLRLPEVSQVCLKFEGEDEYFLLPTRSIQHGDNFVNEARIICHNIRNGLYGGPYFYLLREGEGFRTNYNVIQSNSVEYPIELVRDILK